MCSHSPAISGARIVSPCTQELMVDTGFFDFRELIDKIRSKRFANSQIFFLKLQYSSRYIAFQAKGMRFLDFSDKID